MRTTTSTLLCGALVALGAATPAYGGPPAPTSEQYSGAATITGNNDLLRHDGEPVYAHPRGSVFVSNDLDESRNDLFALYVGARHIFSLTFDGRSYDCAGVSHVFFEGNGWWEAAAEPGDSALGTTGIWCDLGNNTAYAVRYPGYPRPPATNDPDEADSTPCVVATRLEDGSDGGRQYRFATSSAAPGDSQPEQGPLDPILNPGGSPQDPAATSSCPAKVFHVTNVNNSRRASTQEWSGEAAFEVLASLQPPKGTGKHR